MVAWCPSCVGQAAAIKQVSSEYGNKLNVLVIDLWAPQNIGQSAQGLHAETANDSQAFMAKNGSPQWNAALDTGGVTIKYGITQVDSTVVLDRYWKHSIREYWSSWLSTTKGCFGKSSDVHTMALDPVLISAGAVAFSKSMRLCYDSNLHIVFC